MLSLLHFLSLSFHEIFSLKEILDSTFFNKGTPSRANFEFSLTLGVKRKRRQAEKKAIEKDPYFSMFCAMNFWNT